MVKHTVTRRQKDVSRLQRERRSLAGAKLKVSRIKKSGTIRNHSREI